MKTTTILNADLFIIPNGLVYVSDMDDFYTKMWSKDMKSVGLPDIKLGDDMVNVWITDEKSDNWASHGRQVPEIGEDLRWPTYLRKADLEGLREGESKEFTLKNGVKLVLTARQQKYRYKGFSTFEEVLNKLAEEATEE